MRLYTFEVAGMRRIGAEHDGQLIDLSAARAGLPTDMLAFIQLGHAELQASAEELASMEQQPTHDLRAVRLLAPIPRPGKILCSGVNYRSHQQENPGAILPETPGFFSKLPTAVIGPGEPIIHPRASRQVDYEVELAVVIGRTMRHTPESEALEHVFGYTILHDVSARDFQFKQPRDNNITLGKNFDTFAPMGPCIVTADELTDPANLRLRTLLNGLVVQEGSTSHWLFPLPYLLSFLSGVMTLEPGDIVTTGTPAGVGVFHNPPLFLQPGDVVALEIEGIGRLENPVVKEG
jgi:2-keto-4-pentenoate hydratase/2-oxohepta-3-ene-1,7-dioic acid hydratase in catechol pathway